MQYAVLFFTYDANSICWHIEIENVVHDNTAFTFRDVLYLYVQISSTLKNTRGKFQRAVDLIFMTVKLLDALVYLGDTVIFSKLEQGHNGYIQHILILLRQAWTMLKLENFDFFTDNTN